MSTSESKTVVGLIIGHTDVNKIERVCLFSGAEKETPTRPLVTVRYC